MQQVFGPLQPRSVLESAGCSGSNSSPSTQLASFIDRDFGWMDEYGVLSRTIAILVRCVGAGLLPKVRSSRFKHLTFSYVHIKTCGSTLNLGGKWGIGMGIVAHYILTYILTIPVR
eukprot:Platyproteum_vivax@DN15107_c0_g1_i1.p1